MIALTPNETWDHTPASEAGADSPAVFVLRYLSEADQRAAFRGIGTTAAGDVFMDPPKVSEILKFALVGWRGIVDGKGNEVRFQTEGRFASSSSIARIPVSVRYEIAADIIRKHFDEVQADLGK